METKAKSLEPVQKIDGLVTPSLLLDRGKLERNINRLADHARRLGVVLRPHMKTAKSIDVARQVFPTGPGPITVSTIAEAEYFASHGYRDMTYAVGLSPASALRASELCRRTGVDLKLLLDTVEQADALADVRKATGVTPSVFIELDCDDHRGGLKPDDPKLIEVADRVVAAGAHLVGVLAHAGESYGLSTPDALVKAAENERSATVRAAEILRAQATRARSSASARRPPHTSPRISMASPNCAPGSTCSSTLSSTGSGSVPSTTSRFQCWPRWSASSRKKDWVLVDAGWMALSRDRGTASQRVDQGYGLVCDEAGRVLEDVIVSQASQEHGILAIRSGSAKSMPELRVGARLRILPNHACAMAGQHDFYSVVNGGSPEIDARWERIRGW